jgi:hypothetical protein
MESKFILLNNLVLPYRWLLWTSKNLIGLDPKDPTFRERLASSINVLGTAAGLFLVIAVATLLAPPGVQSTVPPKKIYLDIFGVFMFLSAGCYIGYIAYALTVFHPISQSLRDDVLFDAYERYMRRWGGYELFLFDIGLHFMIFGLVIGCYILYSRWALVIILFITVAFYEIVIFLSRECFLALDPISAKHLGLSNSQNSLDRAEKLSKYLLYKIPNNILKRKVEEDTHGYSPVRPGDELGDSISQENVENLDSEAVEQHRPFKTSRPSSGKIRSRPPSGKKPVNSVFSVSSALVQSEKNKKPPSIANPKDWIQLPEVILPRELHDLMTKGNYLISKLSLKDCEFIYEKLSKKGFNTLEELLDYLNETKQLVIPCFCSKYHRFVQQEHRMEEHQHEEPHSPNMITSYFQAPHAPSSANLRDFNDEDGNNNAKTEKTELNQLTMEKVKLYSPLHMKYCSTRLVSCWISSLEKLEIPYHFGYEVIMLLKPYLK